jgi:hypothetical protein
MKCIRETARLGKENAILRERLSKISDATFCGLTFDEMYQMLLDEEVDLSVGARKSEVRRMPTSGLTVQNRAFSISFGLCEMSSRLMIRSE